VYKKLENKLSGRNSERAIVPSVNESEGKCILGFTGENYVSHKLALTLD
jgi:hypothetical protein